MNYRERCYKYHVSGHWQFIHSLSRKEYDLYAKVSKKRFRNILPKNKTAKIIDIACGAGHFLYFLQKEGYLNTQGIDLSWEQLDVAKKMGVKNLKQANLFEYLSKYSQCFDMVIANDIIEHLKKDEVFQFLDLIYQSLKPSALFLVSTSNAQSLFGSASVFCDFTHEQGFTPESLYQVLRVFNFKDVKVFGERPIVHDFRSALRAGLWAGFNNMLKFYIAIERGTGRGLWKHHNILEPRIFALARKNQ